VYVTGITTNSATVGSQPHPLRQSPPANVLRWLAEARGLPPLNNRLDNVGREQSQPQDSSDVGH
jgi:hypothetical protein